MSTPAELWQQWVDDYDVAEQFTDLKWTMPPYDPDQPVLMVETTDWGEIRASRFPHVGAAVEYLDHDDGFPDWDVTFLGDASTGLLYRMEIAWRAVPYEVPS